MKNLLLALAFAFTATFAHAAEDEGISHQKWSFEGVNGKWDKAELYRGYTVATQVCLACHSFKYVTHRDLMRAGFTENEVKTMAAALKMDINDKFITGLDSETAVGSYGKVPPDLSLMPKAREEGADYVYSVLTGYSEDPAVIAEHFPSGLPANAHFNKAFPGHAIAMPQPLQADAVSYEDGTKATLEQEAHDVATFLQWTAEPERIERQHLGVYVLLYLVIFTILAYLTKRAIWKDVKGH